MRLIVKPDLNSTIIYFVFLYYSYKLFKFIKKKVKDKNLIQIIVYKKLKNFYNTLKKRLKLQ